MKTWSQLFPYLARNILVCLMACVFFSQSTLVVSAHQMMSHKASEISDISKISFEFGQNCQNDRSSGNKPASHINSADCCLFCQPSDSGLDPSEILEFAKVVAILVPVSEDSDLSSHLEYRPIVRASVGLKSSWSAQAPPQA